MFAKPEEGHEQTPSSAARLRESLAATDVLIAPGVYDPLGARIVEDLGFAAVYLGGWATGAHLATPEPLVTMSEQVAVAARVVRATSLPLIVDAGAGFGEPLHTIRTVRELESAGVAALHLEDQRYPKRAHYHKGVEHVEERDVFLAKLRVALDARQDPSLMIIARTDAAKAVGGSAEEAVWRCRAALDAGADAVMPLTNDDETLMKIRRALPADATVVCLGGYLHETGDRSIDEYADAGFRIVLHALAAVIVAAGAIRKLYAPLKQDGHLLDAGPLGIDAREFEIERSAVEKLIGLSEHYEVERRTVEGPR